MTDHFWTPARTKLLTELWEAGESPSAIAETITRLQRLDVSERRILAKAKALGFAVPKFQYQKREPRSAAEIKYSTPDKPKFEMQDDGEADPGENLYCFADIREKAARRIYGCLQYADDPIAATPESMLLSGSLAKLRDEERR